MSCQDSETLHPPELQILKPRRPQKKKKQKKPCSRNLLCRGHGRNGLLRPGWTVRSLPWGRTAVAGEDPSSLPDPAFPSSTFQSSKSWPVAPTSAASLSQIQLPGQPAGRTHLPPCPVTDLLAPPVSFHPRLFLHFIKRFFLCVKRALWRKESEASHSSHFVFTKYFLCNTSDGFGLETRSSCLALFQPCVQTELHSATQAFSWQSQRLSQRCTHVCHAFCSFQPSSEGGCSYPPERSCLFNQ